MSDVDNIAPEVRKLWTRSEVTRQAKRILGPFARLRQIGEGFQISLEKGKVKIPLGSGVDPYGAFYATFVLPQKAREAQEEYAREQEAKALAASALETPAEPSAPVDVAPEPSQGP